MAKWIYEKWDLKWDLSKFPSTPNSNSKQKTRVNIQNMEIEDVVPKVGDVSVTRNNTDDYNADITTYMSAILIDNDPIYVHKAGRIQNKKSWLATQRIKNTLQGTIVAEEGTYPDDGVHTDGYWYVKIKKAFPEIRVTQGTTLKTATVAYVVQGGVLKSVTDMYVVQDGQLKKAR